MLTVLYFPSATASHPIYDSAKRCDFDYHAIRQTVAPAAAAAASCMGAFRRLHLAAVDKVQLSLYRDKSAYNRRTTVVTRSSTDEPRSASPPPPF
jgi:hypothetical protein